jgi:hypothetical protein
MTTFKKNLNFFALDDLAPTPRMCPKIFIFWGTSEGVGQDHQVQKVKVF